MKLSGILTPHLEFRAGTVLGSYEILAPLGAGGMGEVYRAKDRRLGREVAIKVLPEHISGDQQALKRFEREAKAVAALSHPNIVAAHHLGTENSVSYLVTELLEGETLQKRIDDGVLPWRKAVEIAAAIADGLDAAHAKGIIHRDLKPSNVFVTREGRVKILDFGLARLSSGLVSSDSSTDLATSPGQIMGTTDYMSPEQLCGDPVDHRTDIFSLGCVLYASLTGQPPFARASAPQTMTAILRDEPKDLSTIRTGIPADVSRIIKRCLEKNREERFQSARDLAFDLRALLVSGGRVAALRRPQLAGTVVAVAAIVALIGIYLNRGRHVAPAHTSAIQSLAVLPFENPSKDPESEYLSDGVTEALINSFSRLPDLRVVARTTAFSYKDKPLDLDQLSRQLNIDAVLTGRLITRGPALIVQADLTHVKSGSQLWGNRYEEPNPNLLSIQQRIFNDVANQLDQNLSEQQQKRLATRYSTSGEAYALYLKGRYHWNKRNVEALLKAKDFFQRSIDADPTFALAYSGLADTYLLLGGEYRVLPQEEGLAKAGRAAQQAIDLNPDLVEAHTSLAMVSSRLWRWDEAEREFRRALILNPNYPTLRHWYSLLLFGKGQIDESLSEIRKAQELDPLSPNLSTNVASRLNHKGDYDGAIAECKKALEIEPRFFWAFYQMGVAYEGQKRYAEAVDAFQRLGELKGVPPFAGEASVARVYAKMGRTGEAQKMARELESLASQGRLSPVLVASIYDALGDRDREFSLLERGLETRDEWIVTMVRSDAFISGRSDPRYAKVLSRIGRPSA